MTPTTTIILNESLSKSKRKAKPKIQEIQVDIPIIEDEWYEEWDHDRIIEEMAREAVEEEELQEGRK